jgi:hypothetical protein
MSGIGYDVDLTFTSDNLAIEGKGHGLGDRMRTHDGKEYVWVQASGAITGDGYVCSIDEDYQAVMVDTDTRRDCCRRSDCWCGRDGLSLTTNMAGSKSTGLAVFALNRMPLRTANWLRLRMPVRWTMLALLARSSSTAW